MTCQCSLQQSNSLAVTRITAEQHCRINYKPRVVALEIVVALFHDGDGEDKEERGDVRSVRGKQEGASL
jgi:hypothetical protein